MRSEAKFAGDHAVAGIQRIAKAGHYFHHHHPEPRPLVLILTSPDLILNFTFASCRQYRTV